MLPIKGSAYSTKISLHDLHVPGAFKDSPTIDAGDVKVRTDAGSLAAIITLPTASGVEVSIDLDSDEMNGDNVWVQFIDQTSPKQWVDFSLNIETQSVVVIPTAAEIAAAVVAALPAFPSIPSADDVAAAVVAALPPFPTVPNTTDIAIAVRAKFATDPLVKAETLS